MLKPVALVAALAALALPAAARAGTYTVVSCQDVGGAPLSASAWTTWFSDPDLDTGDNSCPRGGVHIQLRANAAHPPDAAARIIFYVPDSTLIVHYRLWRSARVKVGSAYYFNTMERFGGDWKWSNVGCTGNVGNCGGVGNPSVPLANDNLWDRTPPTPVTGIALYISCARDNNGTEGCPATPGVSSETWLHRSEVTLSDDVKPVFETAPTGALVAATGPVSGVVPVSILASDKGGGLAEVQVVVDGQVVATQAAGGNGACRPPYTASVPCPLRTSMTIPVDTAGLSDGHHTVQVVARDVAGNQTAWGPADLVTANTPPDVSCDTNPLATAAPLKLMAGLVVAPARGTAAPPRATRTIRYATSRPASLQGRLLDTAGAPVPNAPVCVVARPAGSTAVPQPLARVSTDADGRFVVKVPQGPSRELWAIHRVAGGALAPRVVLKVIPRVTLHPSHHNLHNGDLLVLRGTLRGGPIPTRGVLIRAEAWRGTRWQPFGETRARGAAGTFKLRYRFTGTTGSQRYTLRVKVPAQSGYPYTTGTSARIHVRVRG